MSNLSIIKLVLFIFFMAGIGAISTGSWGAEYDCGELKNFGDIGPWDYADPSSSVPTGADPMGRI